ncbi:MAG: TolC family protein, partial [Armatimonadota bacterium]
MNKLALAIYLTCLLNVAPSGAEEPKGPEPWSLGQCINAALQNQVDVLSARNNVLIARSRTVRAFSNYFPQLSVQNNAFAAGSRRGVLGEVSTGTALTVTQNIFDGGLREANVLSARYSVRANLAGLARTEQTVIFAVTSAYYELLRARHLEEVARKNVQYNEELRKQVEAMVGEGEAAKIDILPVEAQLATARVNLLSAQNAVRTAAIRLQNEMGFAPQPGFDIREIEAPPDQGIASLDIYLHRALENRPDVIQRQAIVGSARAELKSARLALYPRPVITGEYQHRVYGGLTSSATQIVGGFVFDIFNG